MVDTKAKLLKPFRDSGVTVLEGDLIDHENLVNVLRQVDVVIATVSGSGVREQVNILKAAKEAGTIKDTGNDNLASPPLDKVTIWGDGTAKGIVNNEEDLATFTLKAILDAGTENKTLHIVPRKTGSLRDNVIFWEKKIGHTLEKTVVSQAEVAKITQGTHTVVPG
ncbi:hypothetical protein R1sor_017156 [Riccia sorocarpa]|uniref:NmrA-like domain-containing protein n=1 Tax=Riccia sorocarpa TaxID=122646 RepID=A0ABD3I9D1_9MARC